MKHILKYLTLITVFATCGAALGTTCVHPHDWDPDICELEKAADRCDTLRASRIMAKQMCKPEACPPVVGGGCHGFLGSNEWFVIMYNGQDMRCACGCVAEETVFQSQIGDVKAADLVTAQSDGSLASIRLLSAASFSAVPESYYGIEQVVAGAELDDVYTITTEYGGTITVSKNHPVVVAYSEDSRDQMMTVGSAVKVGSFLFNAKGHAEKISAVNAHRYDGRVINFNIRSPSRLVYPNGFKMGDNAWQQFLARKDSRVLTIADIIKAIDESKSNG